MGSLRVWHYEHLEGDQEEQEGDKLGDLAISPLRNLDGLNQDGSQKLLDSRHALKTEAKCQLLDWTGHTEGKQETDDSTF